MNSDYSIVIQGCPDMRTLSQLEHYAQYGPVFVAYEDTQSLPPEAVDMHRRGIADFINVNSKLCDGYNRQNIQRQAITTMAAMERVRTRNVIKIRSDEVYIGLDRVIAMHQRAADKTMTTAVYFRKDSSIKFHAGDHFMVGPTGVIGSAFHAIRQACHCFTSDVDAIRWNCVAEVLITRAILSEYGEILDPAQSKALMVKHFDIIPTSCFDTWSWRVYDWGINPPGRVYVNTDEALRKYINDPCGQCVFNSMQEL